MEPEPPHRCRSGDDGRLPLRGSRPWPRGIRRRAKRRPRRRTPSRAKQQAEQELTPARVRRILEVALHPVAHRTACGCSLGASLGTKRSVPTSAMKEDRRHQAKTRRLRGPRQTERWQRRRPNDDEGGGKALRQRGPREGLARGAAKHDRQSGSTQGGTGPTRLERGMRGPRVPRLMAGA